MGLMSRCAARKPSLTRRHRALRLAFARKYVNRGCSFWSSVLFTDETRIAIRNDCNKIRVRKKDGERLHFITPTVKHPPAVMMWGAFAANGVGRMALPPSFFWGGGPGSHLTQCRLAEVYIAIKWHLDPSSRLATTEMGR